MARAELRASLSGLTEAAQRELEALWQLEFPNGGSAEQIRDFLMEVLPLVGQNYGDAAATLAAEWFDDARERASAPGSFSAVIAPDVTPKRWESLARWGVDPLFRPTPDPASALTLVKGGLQRTVADQHRETIARSSIADPAAKGWKRVGVGDTCKFCSDLLGRGAVYTTSSVHFRSHDNCRCAAAPAWNTKVVDISHANDDFTPSARFRSDEARRANSRALRNY